MCGRFCQVSSAADIAAVFKAESSEISPRYNVAPSQAVVAIVRVPDPDDPQVKSLQWGLIPSWAKDPKIGSKLINARAETVSEKPSFRSAFRKRRCLIPANGFYEWQQVEGSRQKQPYFIGLQDEGLFAFAGLYEQWGSPDGDVLETCTIITTTANELMAPIHERMPVILAEKEYTQWLDPSFEKIDRLQVLLDPYPASEMKLYPVSSLVNNPKNDSPDCKQPMSRSNHQFSI
jgi:putative SOS response-associated peptidase YedK